MKCPDQPHVHAELECMACLKVGEYIFVEALEALDCVYCGFEVQVPEERVKSIRGELERDKKKNTYSIRFDGNPLQGESLLGSPRPLRSIHLEPPPLNNREIISLYLRDPDAYFRKYMEPQVPPGLRDTVREFWNLFKPTPAQIEETRRRLGLGDEDESFGYSGA